MEEEFEKNEGTDKKERREDIFSKVVRAGKRTYFFDVKATRKNDYYLTITESKKKFNKDGRYYFEKHKVFLYKEDFEKFTENLSEVIDFIKTECPQPSEETMYLDKEKKQEPIAEEVLAENYTNVDFEDLDQNKE